MLKIDCPLGYLMEITHLQPVGRTDQSVHNVDETRLTTDYWIVSSATCYRTPHSAIATTCAHMHDPTVLLFALGEGRCPPLILIWWSTLMAVHMYLVHFTTSTVNSGAIATPNVLRFCKVWLSHRSLANFNHVK